MTQPTEYQAGIQTLAVWQRPLRGPVTRRRLRRFLTGAAVVAAAAVGLALGAGNGPLRAFALGLLLPGGGFAYGADNPWLAAALVMMTVLALVPALAMWAAVNFTQYALAMAQRHHTPAFHRYLSAAQRNRIDKMLDPQVWGYWRLENLWGNLDLNPDPIRRANIMFSGYFGLMLSLYRNATGDPNYDRPGCLEFRTRGGRVFRYDHPTIMRILAEQFDAEPSGLWACEPGWAYPMCNSLGAAGVVGAEPHHGQDLAAGVVETMRRGFNEEYTYPDGSVAAVRSVRFGFATPGVGTASIWGSWQRANLALLLRPVDPVAAQRQWEILRHEDAERVDGAFTLRRSNFTDRSYPGDQDPSMAGFWSWLYADAREFGDPDLAAAALQHTEEQLGPRAHDGARAYDQASVHANAVFAFGRFIDEHGYTDAVCTPLPRPWATGPMLADAPYPECLVARAESDGSDLRLVLRPGAGAQRVTLSLARLSPGRTYSVTGGAARVRHLIAGRDGTAALQIDLGDRVEIGVQPAA